MDKNTVIITEKDGKYQIENNGISEFALIGILESIVFDMKSANRKELVAQQEEPSAKEKELISLPEETIQESKEAEPETTKKVIQKSDAPDLRTRINNAIKAIRGLGGKIEDSDLNDLTDEELQSELEELTNQYKRLKSSKGTNK